MGLFRRKKQIQLTAIKGVASKILFDRKSEPMIELKFQVEDDETHKLTEVIITMTLWEAGRVSNNLVNAYSTAAGAVIPRATPRIPWE